MEDGDTEKVSTASVIKEEVRRGVVAAMPEMMEKMEKNYNTQLENFKTEAKEILGKSWRKL